MKFLHAMIRVKDLQKSLDFYEKLLNMTFVKKKRLDDCELYYLEDEEHTAQIELTYNDETPENGYKNVNAFGHFAFSVNSMDEFTEKLHSLGYEYFYEPYVIFSGTKIAFVKDPDGNEVELIEKINA